MVNLKHFFHVFKRIVLFFRLDFPRLLYSVSYFISLHTLSIHSINPTSYTHQGATDIFMANWQRGFVCCRRISKGWDQVTHSDGVVKVVDLRFGRGILLRLNRRLQLKRNHWEIRYYSSLFELVLNYKTHHRIKYESSGSIESTQDNLIRLKVINEVLNQW